MTQECKEEHLNGSREANINLDLLEPVFKLYENESGSLISILQKAQDLYGYLPIAALEKISDRTGCKKAKVFGIATFYAQFRLKPLGKYVILQCQGTACYVNGSKEIGKAICEELSMNPGETTEDGLFTLEDVACLGCCSLSPAIMINGEAYGNLTPESVRKIIKDIYDREKGENANEN